MYSADDRARRFQTHRTPCTDGATSRADTRCTPCNSSDTSPRARMAPSCEGPSSASSPSSSPPPPSRSPRRPHHRAHSSRSAAKSPASSPALRPSAPCRSESALFIRRSSVVFQSVSPLIASRAKFAIDFIGIFPLYPGQNRAECVMLSCPMPRFQEIACRLYPAEAAGARPCALESR